MCLRAYVFVGNYKIVEQDNDKSCPSYVKTNESTQQAQALNELIPSTPTPITVTVVVPWFVYVRCSKQFFRGVFRLYTYMPVGLAVIILCVAVLFPRLLPCYVRVWRSE